MRQRGFTLIELLLGLIVSGILAHLAVPNFKNLLESQQRQSAAQSLASGLRYARAQAIGMRPGITSCVIKPAATYAEATAQFHSPAASAGA